VSTGRCPPEIRFDSIQVGVADLGEAARAYTTLLGGEPVVTAEGGLRYQLPVGAVELIPGESRLQSIIFVCDREPAYGGESVPLIFRPADLLKPRALDSGVQAIDHVVVHSPDLDRAVRVWRDLLGLRLALDRTFPERGLRILFFRSGGVTVEIAGSSQRSSDRDRLYGITYRVDSVAAHGDRLRRAGVEVSPVRRGYKQGTTVATVRSGTVGVPTLLLEDPSRGTVAL
jgi:catechol 2,3-dioxygenase-like lactoylglutathione lyase family enzyme